MSLFTGKCLTCYALEAVVRAEGENAYLAIKKKCQLNSANADWGLPHALHPRSAAGHRGELELDPVPSGPHHLPR